MKLLFTAYFACLIFFSSAQEIPLRVMTYNTLFGADGNRVSEILDEIQPDIVVFQEDLFGLVSLEAAIELGYNRRMTKGWWLWPINAVLTKHKIVESNYYGVKIEIEEGKFVWVYPIHLTPHLNPSDIANDFLPKPLPEYAHCGILTPAQVEQETKVPHEREMNAAMNMAIRKNTDNSPVLFLGDYNEPSHLDWTADAVEAEIYNVEVNWFVSNFMIENGFSDAYRDFYPDEVENPGLTIGKFPYGNCEGVEIRIDYIYATEEFETHDVQIVGNDLAKVDYVIEDWPSDHMAVLADMSVAYEEEARRPVVSSYPNPFSNNLNFNVDLPSDANKVEVTISNMLGQVVFSKRVEFLEEGKHNFNWSELKPEGLNRGLYFVTFNFDNEIVNLTMLKE